MDIDAGPLNAVRLEDQMSDAEGTAEVIDTE